MQKTVLFRRAGIVSDRPEGVPFGRAMHRETEQVTKSWIDEVSFGPVGFNSWRFNATDSQGTMTASLRVLVADANCPAPSGRVVSICSPANGRAISGLFNLETSAGDPTGTLQALQVYKDGVVWFSTNAPYFNIATGLEAGTHRITAKGWDASGPYSTTIFVTSTGN